MGECRATRGEKSEKEERDVCKEETKPRSMNTQKKERGAKKRKRGIQMVGKLSNICKKRQRNRTER